MSNEDMVRRTVYPLACPECGVSYQEGSAGRILKYAANTCQILQTSPDGRPMPINVVNTMAPLCVCSICGTRIWPENHMEAEDGTRVPLGPNKTVTNHDNDKGDANGQDGTPTGEHTEDGALSDANEASPGDGQEGSPEHNSGDNPGERAEGENHAAGGVPNAGGGEPAVSESEGSTDEGSRQESPEGGDNEPKQPAKPTAKPKPKHASKPKQPAKPAADLPPSGNKKFSVKL